jgi:hypothetical protein
MGKGFGRGQGKVQVVTHAQAGKTKKLPRGLKRGRKVRREAYRKEEEGEDVNEMLETKAPKDEVVKPMKKLEMQIAAVNFPAMATGKGRRLKHLRKQIMSSVKDLRKKHHQKQTKARKDAEPAMAAQYKKDLERHNKTR